MKMEFPDRSCFFDDGLQFSCTQCGQCCTGEPGTIAVNEEEINAIAGFLRVPLGRLIRRYTYAFEAGRSIQEKANGDCSFFEDGRCSIYPVRPRQCRTYPFWIENVRSEAAWKRTARECPGIGRGRRFDREQILALLNDSLSA